MGLKKKVIGSAKTAEAKSKPEYDPSLLLQQALKAIEDCQPDLARKFLARILESNPNHIEALETMGLVELELMNSVQTPLSFDDIQTAATNSINYFSRAVALEPNKGHAKFLYLGQLSGGKESIDFYQKGVALLFKEIEAIADQSSEEAANLKRKLASALCSMTEIYMTDCCDEPEAESSCEAFVSKAIEYDPLSPEVYSTMASVRLSQCREGEATQALQQSLSLWLGGAAKPGDSVWPTYPQRISHAKLCLELHLLEQALAVLQTCQLENDEDPECWYLFGWAYYRSGGGGDDEAGTAAGVTLEEKLDHWADAQECLQNVLNLDEKYGTADEGAVAHSRELLNSIVPFLVQHNRNDIPDEGEEWVDADDDDEEMDG
ncbi:uncharacterized protein BJ171DRAFT_490641 [Polychytrium aggregatum]|uniref:uncharacterized protein n=1 Tax=Polychytrium aggregatum TaxID=110093 RepID=UPI0022FEFC28|nr:uncharacterized protein BJ171DRAFT_490641 [Polychytrium aggregatum]KAI9208207.1 hypothetical protein BJ171DRAFT_490641 [Polychytrium aggregatum]